MNQNTVQSGMAKPKQLVKPLKIEQMVQDEKAVESLCETRNSCNVWNGSIEVEDDVLF